MENEDMLKINNIMHLVYTEGVMTEEDGLNEIRDICNRIGKAKKKRSEKWDCLRFMPNLFHKLPNQEFNVNNSEVLIWIGKQKSLMSWFMKSANKNGYIKYDKESGTWKGVDL